MTPRVLVTGGTGFIGRHTLAPLAARNCAVHVVARRPPSTPQPPGVELHQADLHDDDAVRRLVARLRPDMLLHLAWDVTPGEYMTSLDNLRWVQSTLNLVQAFHQSGGRRAVCAGTCAEYDWRFGYCSENLTPLRPSSPYAACKHGVAEILAQFSAQVALSLAWGRVFFLYGPQEAPTRLVPSMIGSALDGAPLRLRNPDQIRDYLHVQDVGAAFVSLLFSAVEGPVNIASGEPVSLRDIGRAVLRELDVAERFEPTPQEFTLDPHPLVVADIRRLRSEVGFQPKFSLQAGIKDVVERWRRNA